MSRYRSRIYYLALGIVGAREPARDLAQEAFVQAYVSLGKLREQERFASWLAGITTNLCKMHLRRWRETTLPIEEIEMLGAHYRIPSDIAADAERAYAALRRLPEGTRSVALLYFVDELTMREITDVLGISLTAVKSRIRDARARLQKEMIDMMKQTAKQDEPGDDFNNGLQHKLDLARWYREFADLLGSGVSICSALDMLSNGDYNLAIKDASTQLICAIQSGNTISDSLADLPALTTRQAAAMVRAGEIGGILDWTVRLLADWIELENGQREIELVFWCRTIGSVVSAGADVKSALDCGLEIARNAELKRAVRDMTETAESGRSMREVLARRPDAFPPIVQIAILVGEQEAILGHTLQWAADHMHSILSQRLIGREFHPPIMQCEWTDAFARATAEYTRHDSPAMRSAAATILGRLRAPENADVLVRLLSDPDPQARKAAINGIAEAGLSETITELQERLNDSEVSVRRAAVNAIATLAAHDAAGAVAQCIADADQRVSNTAIGALESMGEIKVLTAAAIELLTDPLPINRLRAAQIIHHHPTVDADEALIRSLDDDVENIALTSALALAKIGRREAVPTLLKMLQSSRHYFVRTSAIALADLGEKSAAPLIRKAVKEDMIPPDYLDLAEKIEKG